MFYIYIMLWEKANLPIYLLIKTWHLKKNIWKSPNTWQKIIKEKEKLF